MTYVVTEGCIKCKYQDCVIVCPVMCFHEAPEIVVIDPDVCVDCDLCVEYCPTKAIKRDEDLAPHEQIFLGLNRELSRLWPVIENKGTVPSDADAWASVPDKLKYLTRVK